MKFSLVYFIAVCAGVAHANGIIPVLKEGIEPAEEPKVSARGLSGPSCDYGDPLGNSASYSYTQLCTTPSNCERNLGGYVVSNYCSGGSNNKCCIRSRCKSPYTGNYCADTRYYVCPGGTFRTGYCPGISTYKCCA